MIDIFISRPTWVPDEFNKGLENFLSFLEEMDLNPRTLGSTDYPNESPLDEVISIMSECKGIIVLGYPQIFISKGSIKDKEITEESMLATEWNHIEASLAYAKGLPLLVIHHKGIKRGVFDKGAVNKFIYSKDLTKEGWVLSQDVKGALKKWKSGVIKVSDNLVSTSKSKAKQKLKNLKEADILALLISHLNSGAIQLDMKAIRYSEIDDELGIPSGSAKKYIKQIVARWRYYPNQEGEEFIIFEHQRDRPRTWMSDY